MPTAGLMADGEKGGGGGAWSFVPTWDGSPQTWRAFKREMSWWLAGLDHSTTTKYNLAARWLSRQSGVVRQRGEEFLPEELAHQPEVKTTDPQTGESYVLTPEHPLAGINKLLRALEEMTGRTSLDKRGELRGQFFNELRRRPRERISEFCTRFRMLVSELRAEGVALPSSELGWFLRDKLGLDPLRKQLLETGLAGKEEYEGIEREVLRLFKDLHTADPLYKRLGDGGRGNTLKPFAPPSSSMSSRSSIPSSAATQSSSSV